MCTTHVGRDNPQCRKVRASNGPFVCGSQEAKSDRGLHEDEYIRIGPGGNIMMAVEILQKVVG